MHLLFLVSSTAILAPVTSARKLRGGNGSSNGTVESEAPAAVLMAAHEDENRPVLIPLVQEGHDADVDADHEVDHEEDDLDIPSHWELQEPVEGMPSSSPIPHQIASRGDLDILQDIVTKDPHWILARDVHGWTLLHEAARSGNVPVCQYLLDMGADPFNFGDSLLAVLAQRLVRRLCKHCRSVRRFSLMACFRICSARAPAP